MADNIQTVCITLPTAMIREIDKAAAQDDRTRSAMIRVIVAAWLKANKPPSRPPKVVVIDD